MADINSTELSFEFFPTKSVDAEEKLFQTWQSLNLFEPEYYSVTFGAAGSSQHHTYDLVKNLAAEGANVVPHISCIEQSKASILELLQEYKSCGVHQLVVLRGDWPEDADPSKYDFHYASELVEFIREQTGSSFHITVAAYPEYHPQSPNAIVDFKNFVNKVRAGADSAITQYFYNSDAYFRFLEECHKEGIDIPIIPGIMPISNYERLVRFSATCSAEIPLWIRRKMEAYGDDQESVVNFGIELVTDLCEKLLEHDAPGLHFYSLNQLEPTNAILLKLGRNLVTKKDRTAAMALEF